MMNSQFSAPNSHSTTAASSEQAVIWISAGFVRYGAYRYFVELPSGLCVNEWGDCMHTVNNEIDTSSL